MDKKIIIGIVLLIALGSYWYICTTKEDSAEKTYRAETLSENSAQQAIFPLPGITEDEDLVVINYRKPEWLFGHAKEQEIEKLLRDTYQEIFAEAKSFRAEYPKSVLVPYSTDISFERRLINEYESILIIDSQYTGGAHGNVNYETYNMKDGVPITLEEYLAEKNVTEEDFISLVNERLRENERDTIDDFSYTHWIISAKKNRSSVGIEMIFPPYRVASYAAGTIRYQL